MGTEPAGRPESTATATSALHEGDQVFVQWFRARGAIALWAPTPGAVGAKAVVGTVTGHTRYTVSIASPLGDFRMASSGQVTVAKIA